MKPGKPHLLIFREILEGDVRKVHANSNDSKTGGGARDLRFREMSVFGPVLDRFFTSTPNGAGVRNIKVFSELTTGIDTTLLELWPPTIARPGELRLAKIHTLAGWAVDKATYDIAKAAGHTLFFYLILDLSGNVWARTYSTATLAGERTEVRDYINARLAAKKANRAVFGSIDFKTLITVP